ncbi:MAG: hypothetical protein V9E89_08410 [Ilumatobacteraceae bacterium]
MDERRQDHHHGEIHDTLTHGRLTVDAEQELAGQVGQPVGDAVPEAQGANHTVEGRGAVDGVERGADRRRQRVGSGGEVGEQQAEQHTGAGEDDDGGQGDRRALAEAALDAPEQRAGQPGEHQGERHQADDVGHS